MTKVTTSKIEGIAKIDQKTGKKTVFGAFPDNLHKFGPLLSVYKPFTDEHLIDQSIVIPYQLVRLTCVQKQMDEVRGKSNLSIIIRIVLE